MYDDRYDAGLLVREYEWIIDALVEISASTEALLDQTPTPSTLIECGRVIDAISVIAAIIRTCSESLYLAIFPDTFPEEWA